MKTTKLAMFFAALAMSLSLSSCLGDDETSGTGAWYGIVKISGSYGSYIFYLSDGSYIVPTNQSALSSDLADYSYAYLIAYYDIEELAAATTYVEMEVYGISAINTGTVSSDIDAMDDYSNVAIKYVSNSSSDGYITFFSKYNMFVPVSYYYSSTEDLDNHTFYIFYDMDEATSSVLTFHLRRYVSSTSDNSSRTSYGTEYIHFNISTPVTAYSTAYGDVPTYIDVEYPFNSSNIDLDEATSLSVSDYVEYADIYDSF